METTNVMVILMLMVSFLLAGFTLEKPQAIDKVMTFKSNVEMSNDISEPSLNDSVQTIVLSFSEEIDPTNITDFVELYKIDALGNQLKENCRINLDVNDNKSIRINNINITSFTQGEEYKLVIDKSLKSKTGLTLNEKYIGYFATNNNFSFQGSPDLKDERSQIIVISDMHLGIDDGFAEIKKNKQAFADFLNFTGTAPNVSEIVIAGDMFDEWFLPMDYEMPDSLSIFHNKIVKNNKDIIDALNKIIKKGDIKVTYVSGNHDLLFSEEEVERIFPGINQVREDIRGLGTYITGEKSEIAIEHSHRYNFFCAPDMISNRNITKNDTSILPPGYFFTRIATSSVIQGHPESNNTFSVITPNKEDETQLNYFYYYQTWKSILTVLPVNENFSGNTIKTNIDGFTETYSINDLLPAQNSDGIIDVNLYKDNVKTWDQRQTLNKVNSKINVADALIGAASGAFTDLQAKTQYFDIDSSKRIVVFGHTHEAKIIPFKNLDKQKTIYANSGTWIDVTPSTSYPTRTFVVITNPKSNSAVQTVNLYQYSDNKIITQWEEGQAITNISSR